MTREEKIDAIINCQVFDDGTWGNNRDFLHWVACLLREGFNGYEKMTDDEINVEYNNIFQTDIEEEELEAV